MFRSVLAAATGYVALAGSVFASLSVAYHFLEGEFVFEGTSDRVTSEWTLVALLLAFLSALLGGFVAGRMGKSTQAVLILIGVVLVLGVASAVYTMTHRPGVVSEVNTSDWGFWDASQGGIQPLWFDFLVPLVGALGVLWGGKRGYPDADV